MLKGRNIEYKTLCRKSKYPNSKDCETDFLQLIVFNTKSYTIYERVTSKINQNFICMILSIMKILFIDKRILFQIFYKNHI